MFIITQGQFRGLRSTRDQCTKRKQGECLLGSRVPGSCVLDITDPRIPDGARRVFSDLADIAFVRVHQARSAVRCSASRIKGELHPTLLRTTCEADFRTLCVLPCISMTASDSIHFVAWCGHF